MEKYYINWSRISGNYLVKEVGEGKIIQIFSSKIKAENFIQKLLKEEEENYGKSTT